MMYLEHLHQFQIGFEQEITEDIALDRQSDIAMPLSSIDAGPSGSNDPLEESSEHDVGTAAGESSKFVRESNSRISQAIDVVRADDVDARKFGSWCDQANIECLANALRKPHNQALTVAFHDHTGLRTNFANQLEKLQLLKHKLNRKGALFISKEPSREGMQHCLFGMVYGNQLLLLDPVGAAMHQDLCESLLGARERGLVEELYLSRTSRNLHKIQEDEWCGYACTELLCHYGALGDVTLGKVMSNLSSLGEKRDKAIAGDIGPRTLSYQDVEASRWLPASLFSLLTGESPRCDKETNDNPKQGQISTHGKVSIDLEDSPEQILFTQLVLEDRDILLLKGEKLNSALAERAACSSMGYSGPVEPMNQDSSEAQRDSGTAPHEVQQTTRARSNVVSRIPDNVQSELDLEQAEAKRLLETMTNLFSKLPQATQEADAQILDDIFEQLSSFLNLDRVCAPSPESDRAMEFLEKLRRDHHKVWSSTAYGSRARKKLTYHLEQVYTQELRSVADVKHAIEQANRVGDLARVLGKLAALHQEQGDETGELEHYTDAAELYQTLLHVCEGKELDDHGREDKSLHESAYSGLVKIRERLVARARRRETIDKVQVPMNQAQLRAEITRDKEVLRALREDAHTRVNQLEGFVNMPGSSEEQLLGEAAYIDGSRALFADIAKGIQEFVARIFEESEQELGPVQCKYTVMGLGSMALKQMTPYSDLEFAILMEEAEDEATSAADRAYLRQITHLVHFRVINLGETVIPKSKYGISLDHLSRRGFSFDLGGKTPLRRRDKLHLKQPYELIQPVSGMLHYLKNEGDKMEHMDKLLPFILESTCYVFGDGELHAAYVAEKNAFLMEGKSVEGLPLHKSRAKKKLLEGVAEMDYCKPGVALAKPRPGDLEDFTPRLGQDYQGRLYDVKEEIYRLPDRLLYRLAMYFGLFPENAWDAVELLARNRIIGVGENALQASHHLQFAVSFAVMLRLRTYLHHGKQDERLALLHGITSEGAQQVASEFFTLPPEALQVGGSLFRYYYTAIPLYSRMQLFFTESMHDKEADLFGTASFYSDSDHAKAYVHRRLNQLPEAAECFKAALTSVEQIRSPYDPFYAQTLIDLGTSYLDLGDTRLAISCFERALAVEEQAHSEDQAVASTLNYLGAALDAFGDPRKAINCYERALAIEKKVFGPDHPKLCTVLNNLGTAWAKAGDDKLAVCYYEQSLTMKERNDSPDQAMMCTTLSNLGYAWDALGDSKRAMEHLERALVMSGNLYGPSHPSVAVILNNLGYVAYHSGNLKEAIKCFRRALVINESMCSSSPQVATTMDNLGRAYEEAGNLMQAISHYEGALAIFEKVHSSNHPDTAMTLNYLGGAQLKLGNVKGAISFYSRALAINEQVHILEHPSVAANLTNLGTAYAELGAFKTAIRYHERALAIHEKLHGLEHRNVAMALNNLAGVYEALGKHKQTITYCDLALAIAELTCGSEHQDVAMILNYVGRAWDKLGNHKKARSSYERALAINEQVYGSDHPNTATSLNNMGCLSHKLHDLDSAISYQRQALAIHEKIPGPVHPVVATILNNLGNTYEDLKNSKQAIECFERALAINLHAYGEEHPDVARTLMNLGSVLARLGNSQQAFSLYERALSINEQFYGSDHPSVATALSFMGSACVRLGESEQATFFHECALAVNQRYYGSEHPVVATNLTDIGLTLQLQKKYKQAIKCHECALKIRKQTFGEEDLKVAATLEILSNACFLSGEQEKAIGFLEQTVTISQHVLGLQHPELFRNSYRLGTAWGLFGDWTRAVHYLELALSIRKQHCPDFPKMGEILDSVGSAWTLSGNSKQAIQYFEQALALYEQRDSEKHPHLAQCLSSLGCAWMQLSDWKQAIGYFERALAIEEQIYPKDDPMLFQTLYNLGCASRQIGELKSANDYYQQSLNILEQIRAPEDTIVVGRLNNLGDSWFELGDPKQAIKCYERALRILQNVDGEDHPSAQGLEDKMKQLSMCLENHEGNEPML